MGRLKQWFCRHKAVKHVYSLKVFDKGDIVSCDGKVYKVLRSSKWSTDLWSPIGWQNSDYLQPPTRECTLILPAWVLKEKANDT